MMSETSTPFTNVHAISPSSSLSSADSAPRSEPTSDEQPDLGAFTTVLREWTHLQPGPRIPVQRRAATSSTTPTFQPTEPSVAGSVLSTSSYRRRRVPSSQSTFTRPPSSSAQPEEGSTVWDHNLIANYLLSATPSNDYDFDDYYELDAVDEEGESQYNPSPPNSLDSPSLTVEINSESDVPTTDNESIRVSPYPSLLVPVQGPDQRLNSRESVYPHEEEQTTEDGSTYRNDASRDSSSGSYSTSLHLQSQAAPASTSSSSGTGVVLTTVSSASSIHGNQSNAANSQSTTMSNFANTVMNRSQNPIPPHTAYPSPNVEPPRYASTSTSGSVSHASLSTQRPTQRGSSQPRRHNSASPPLLNPHSPMPPPRTTGDDRNLPIRPYPLQGVVNDWGTPDQPPSETLVFEPPTARVSHFRPVIDNDDEEDEVSPRPPLSSHTIVPHAVNSDSQRQPVHPHHPTSRVAEATTTTSSYTHNATTAPTVNIEPHNEDEETDEDLYHYRYPYSHGVTPRYHGSALTPKGLPQRQPETRTGAQPPAASMYSSSQHAPTSTTQEHDPIYLTAAHTQTASEPTLSQLSQMLSYPQNNVQHDHRYQQPSHSDNVFNPISQHTHAQPLGHGTHPVQQHQLPATTQTLSHPIENPISHSSYEPPVSNSPVAIPRDRIIAPTAKHGYPLSLLGMHLLPSSIPPPTPDDGRPSFLVDDSSRVQSRLADSDTSFEGHTEQNQSLTGSDDIDNVPSLGALDEVLEFIAIERERARTNAAREAASLRADPDPDSEEHEGSGDEALGDVDWEDVVDNDQDQGTERAPEPEPEGGVDVEAKPVVDKGKGKAEPPDKEVEAEPEPELEQHRRRRRRKRPAKSHAATLSTDSVGTPSTSALNDSPAVRKRRRVRSSSRSAASLLQTPGKEKEFLVDPSTLVKSSEQAKSQITILKRPSATVSSDEGNPGAGAKTPTASAFGGRDLDMRNRDAFQDRALHADDLQFDFESDGINPVRAVGAKGDTEGEGNDTSLSNMPLLQPPPKKRDKSARASTRDAAYIHEVLGGSYRSTPASPGRLPKPEKMRLDQEAPENADARPSTPLQDIVEEAPAPSSEKKKRVRKHKKAIPHAKSVPDLKTESEQQNPSPAATIANPLPGLSRAKSLNKQSQHATLRGRNPSDTQRDQLEHYLAATYNANPGLFMMDKPREAAPQPEPNSKRGRLVTLAQQLRQSFPEQSEELSKLITRFSQAQGQKVKGKRGKSVFDGLDTTEGDHDTVEEDEEVDTRGRASKRSPILTHVFIDHSNILIGLLTHIRRLRSKRRKSAMKNPASAFAAVKPNTTRPLPMPISGDGIGMTVQTSHSYPIPLPSFATSRSLPTKSILSSYMESKGTHFTTETPESDPISDDYDEVQESPSKVEEKNRLTHMWHAALVLILERGRDINRRVVVTSSPLYQPMDSIERLGYELRVYMRVPDLGDGMDRERQKEKYGNKSSSSGKSSNMQSPARAMGHMRQPSGNISTDSGNDGLANATPPRVKYREQGVDELLQLKLHQALIATDEPPEGSTIVLATGDGNTGQFNEDGFLGAVRAALRKGWKVELYSWEYGLSSSWRRDFGEFSRRGMFRIIYMEQFASSLLEANTLL